MGKRIIALALAVVLVCSCASTGLAVNAKAAGYVTVADLSDRGTPAPAKDAVVPDANQYEYQKQELSAFCHFGPNTFNEIEWGESYGSRTPDDIFKLEENFDAETMVATLKAAGFKKLIITAKHHDGFCIWNSAYTDYDVESTSYADYNYDGLGGDILAEISAACTKYDMDMGLYLSPWDIHEPSYGSVDGNAYNYNDYYNNQLEEILSNDELYGNAGHFCEVWMDGAKGSGAYAQDYDFQRWFATIQKYEGIEAGYAADAMLFGAEGYSTVYWIGNESGLANEETWAKVIADKVNNTLDRNHPNGTHYSKGWSNGNQWAVPEADSRITSGWFWGNYKKTPATMTELANRYFASVGYNSTMLLNVPPNDVGTVDEAILNRVVEFGQAVQDTFVNNKAAGAAVSATEVRGNDIAYSPANVIDGDASTYWTVEDGTTSGSLIVDLGHVTTFDVVSIEESIEFGQRITSFSVEYSTDGNNWQTMKEGSTIGAKRLCRTVPVKARYVKITVATDDTDVYTSTNKNAVAKGTVPMIAEVGIYKASEGFELAAAAPDGMTVIDDRDPEFTFTGRWNNESGTQFPIEQTGKWCDAGPSFTVNFTGSKIYLVGTVDPNHSTANVKIDDGAAVSINTYNATRMLGQVIYESEDLEYGEHTLTLNATGTIGIDGAYVIDNNGLGMIGIEYAKYTMEEDDTIEVKLIRTGGSEGEVTVLLSPNPGSAIQDDYDTECITEVVFADGETEKTAPVRTRRNTNATGDRYFTIELSSDSEDLILGFNSVARVTIKDAEAITVEKLQELIDEYANQVLPMCQVYTAESWAAFEELFNETNEKIANDEYTAATVKEAYDALVAARVALVSRDTETGVYAENDRFQFPGPDETMILEMEYAQRVNNTENDNGWPLMVTEAAWASNGNFLNCLNANDQAIVYYNALRTGTYTATVTFRSGDSKNSIVWSEADGKIAEGSVTAGADDAAGATHTATFVFNVVTAGEGTLTFKGGAYKAPQIDKIEITPADIDLFTFGVTKTAIGNGTIVGPDEVTECGSAEFTFTADEGYEVKSVTVNGTSVGAVTSYVVEYVTEAIEIEVVFGKMPADPTDGSKDVAVGDMVAISDSQYLPGTNNEGPDDYILDGKTSTHWHTNWQTSEATDVSKRWVGVSLNEVTAISAVRIHPRTGESKNGNILEYVVQYRASDNGEWIDLATGEWAYNDISWKIVEFDAVNAKQVRIVGVHTYADSGNDAHMSLAEFRVVKSDEVPAEPEHTCTFDRQVATEAYLATAADCENAATYYYSCECGLKSEETFAHGEALGHDYGEPVFTWNDDNTAKAVFTCERDEKHTHEETATVTSETTEGDCQTKATTTYTATVTFEDETYTDTKTVEGEIGDHTGDTNNDHKCDKCGAELSECADTDKNHKCDLCGAELSECADTDKNHKCDLCGTELSQCADADKNHKCDVCDKVLSECVDADKDYKCDICGKDLEKPEDPTDPTDPEQPEKPVIEDVTRLAGANRWETSLKVADEMKANLGLEKFDAIIIASGNDFADALAGSYLSTVKNAPILLGWGKGGKYVTLDEANIAYIKANLAEGGTVYILGGKNAVPELYETELKGYNVKRLGGANRFETNLLILEEAGVAEGAEILVCTSTNFADSLSASATAKPILLVFNAYGKLYGKQPEFLAGLKNCTFTVIGGENAVSAKLFDAIKAYGTTTRLAGANRFETSVLVAQKYFASPETAVLAYAWNYPDGLCGGSLAYSLKAPLILTMTKYEAKAVEYAKNAGIEIGLVLGGDTLISDEAVRAIFAMDAADGIVEK